MLKPAIEAINKLIIRELSDMNDKIIEAINDLVSELKRLNENLERLPQIRE